MKGQEKSLEQGTIRPEVNGGHAQNTICDLAKDEVISIPGEIKLLFSRTSNYSSSPLMSVFYCFYLSR